MSGDILSNWDAMALDDRSEPTTGITEPSSCGVKVEIHRNWVNVRDQGSWKPGCLYPRPIVATVIEGEITVQDVSVLAARGPQQGVYVATWFVAGGVPCGMVGIGCFGFSGGRYEGVTAASIAHLNSLVRRWASEKRCPSDLLRIDMSRPLRFCQGDLFIAQGAGFPVPSTPPGEALPPLAAQSQPKGSP